MTDVPLRKELEHVFPQSIPEGELVTDPLPLLFIVRLYVFKKMAKTEFPDRFMVMLQSFDPEQSPPHFWNPYPGFAIAVSETREPSSYW